MTRSAFPGTQSVLPLAIGCGPSRTIGRNVPVTRSESAEIGDPVSGSCRRKVLSAYQGTHVDGWRTLQSCPALS
eukprot:10042264-Alexandrium_andersonii.AAC.1